MSLIKEYKKIGLWRSREMSIQKEEEVFVGARRDGNTVC